MTTRYASALILASLSFGAVAAPVSAQGIRTPEAGLRFEGVSSRRDVDAARALQERSTGYVSSSRSDLVTGSIAVTPPVTRTLNVWGARIDAPNY